MRRLESRLESRAPIVILKIDVTGSCNELLRDGRMPMIGRGEERRLCPSVNFMGPDEERSFICGGI